MSGQPPPVCPATVTGPAVFGYDTGEALVWRPCCKAPVRLAAADLASVLPTVVRCDRERCQRRLWTVELHPSPLAGERVAVWRAVSR